MVSIISFQKEINENECSTEYILKVLYGKIVLKEIDDGYNIDHI